MARYTNAVPQYSDINGVPLPGNQLFFYETGTTTFKNTFSDAGLTTPNANPVVSDASGQIPDIFLDGTYKVVLKDADDVTIWTRDPIGETASGTWTAWLNDVTYAIPEIVLGSDDNYYRSLTDANQGNDPTSSAANWEQLELGRIWNTNVTYALGDEAIGSDGMLYFSLIAANLANNPTSDGTAANWRAADQMRSANATGSVDIITATYIPAVAVLKDGLILRVRASGANTNTATTFAPNGLTAKTIVKYGNISLVVGDINAAGHELLLAYSSTNDNWELLNPENPLKGLIVEGTPVDTDTSATSYDFTSIPSGVKSITVSLSGVSTNGTSNIQIQIGDGGGIEVSGYDGVSTNIGQAVGTSAIASATGFGINSASAAWMSVGSIVLTRQNFNIFLWAAAGDVASSGTSRLSSTAGTKALSAELDRVRLTTVNGTDTFDAGQVNIQYQF
jgi:hypothetical protein